MNRRPRSLTHAATAWWQGLPPELRSTKWPMAFSLLVILALLLGFHSVVQSAVKQGELLRMNVATRAQAEWRCRALQGDRMRASCLHQLDAPPAVAEAATPPVNSAAVRVAQR